MESFPAVLSITVCPFLGILFLSLNHWKRQSLGKIPPGNLGFPVIGKALQFVWALRSGTIQLFFDERVKKFGDVFKTSLMGDPTVLLYGPAGNRLVLSNEDKLVEVTLPKSFTKLLGSESLGSKRKLEHLRMRAAIARCLGPQALKNYMFKMSFEIQRHITEKWKGKSRVKMFPLVKELIFSLAASLFFGISDGAERTQLHHLFETMVAASFAVPLDFPGTHFYLAIKARSIIDQILSSLIKKRRAD
ncbi:hypothetical protein SUGI_0693630 [Cryptomeria japonica]|nr:hypothetical protein SUGI_0693630 [Cryptomeria japonica]